MFKIIKKTLHKVKRNVCKFAREMHPRFPDAKLGKSGQKHHQNIISVVDIRNIKKSDTTINQT